MPACWATRLASPRSRAPQQRPLASTPEWSQSSIERPTTGRPSLASNHAVTEESRPPLMATAVRGGEGVGVSMAGPVRKGQRTTAKKNKKENRDNKDQKTKKKKPPRP